MYHPIARQRGLVMLEMPDDLLVYDIDANQGHCLNRSAAIVWNLCDGSNSVTDMVREFETASGGKVTEDFVWLAIDQLIESKLIDGTTVGRFATTQSRRQALRSIGLASMTALPVISSLVMPPNTLGNVNCACTSNADCNSPSMAGCPARTCNTRGVCAPQ
jgi:hypothetical protein